jgi:DNA-directed RNA polymerase specialized sigma24 family protein
MPAPNRLIVIPQTYDGSKAVEPIVLDTLDPNGNVLSSRLFAEGVAPYYARLCRISVRYLHDVHRVSDLTQAAVYSFAKRWDGGPIHDRIVQDAGDIARDWRRRRGEKAIYRTQLTRQNAEQWAEARAIEERQVEDRYLDALYIRRVIETMRSATDSQEQYILNLFLAGLNYEEIAEHVGGRHRSAIRSLIHVRARRAANQITKDAQWTKSFSNAWSTYRKKPSLHIQTRSGLAARAANG